MTLFAKALTITVILAITGFFLASVLGLDAASLAIGLFLGGLVASLVSKPASAKPAARASARPAAKPQSTAASSSEISADDADTETLFVGNLAFRANRHNLMKLFSEHGKINNARIVTDRNTRKPKGYGFVEVATGDVDNVIAKLDGADFFGRELKVSRANKRD